MNLVWHIAKKDLRRMALPVAGWCAFIAATTIGFRLIHPPSGDALMAEVEVWTRLMGIWTQLIVGVKIVITYLLAGALVLEDALPGTAGFWQTRPIAGARLLAAKLLASLLLFVIAPLVVLTPLWLANGFSVSEIVASAWWFALGQCVVLAVSFAMASLSCNLAQFLFATLGLGFACVLCSAYFTTAPFIKEVAPAVRRARGLILQIGLVPAAVAVFAHQFLTRRSARSWVLVGIALAAGFAVRLAGPWDVTPVAPSVPPTAAIDVAPQLTKPRDTDNIHYTPSLSAATPWNQAGFYVPTGAWRDDGEPALKLAFGWQTAARRMLGFDRSKEPIRWRLNCTLPIASFTPENAPTWHGQLSVWFAVPRVLGEMPLREGATFVAGSTRTRILGFAKTGEVIDKVFVEVCEAKPGEGDGIRALLRPNFGSFEEYFCINRARHEAVPLGLWNVMGGVAMHSFLVTCKQLTVSGAETGRDSTLAVVRFERVGEFAQPIEVHGLKWEEPR